MNREEVIKGLEVCSDVDGNCYDCPYMANGGDPEQCDRQAFKDALALLKEQEPQVLKLEEVEALPYGHVLIETDKSGSLRWLDALLFCKNANFSFDFITLEGRARLLGTEYNREWRCWTSRPTDEQREAVKWDEPPKEG